jgi:hypothetical protein
MLVSELIEQLRELPSDAAVVIKRTFAGDEPPLEEELDEIDFADGQVVIRVEG